MQGIEKYNKNILFERAGKAPHDDSSRRKVAGQTVVPGWSIKKASLFIPGGRREADEMALAEILSVKYWQLAKRKPCK